VRWVVVVPVKDAAAGKTRLAEHLDGVTRVALARAMALDTIAAATGCAAVEAVVVVRAEAPQLPGAHVVLVDEPGPGRGSPLDRAVLAGVARARARHPLGGVAVLLGDLPALRPGDLADALAAAAGHDRAVVPDAAGTGTTLLTALPDVGLSPRFGAGSAAAHAGLGHVVLDVGLASSLRHDVDLPGDLDATVARGTGPRTRAVLHRHVPD